jgi:protein involved in polysaccharide export with SLBB domain
MHHRLSVALLMDVTVVGGGCCSTLPKQDLTPVGGELEDRLHPGDDLVIDIEANPPAVPSSLRIDRTVQQDGTVALVSNRVFRAAGKTRSEFRREVRAYYVPKYFKSVLIWGSMDFSTYYVGGGVLSPGRLLCNSATPLGKTIVGRGGFTPSANKKKVQLIRVDGERRIIDCARTSLVDNDVNVVVGDTVIVPRLSKWPFW